MHPNYQLNRPQDYKFTIINAIFITNNSHHSRINLKNSQKKKHNINFTHYGIKLTLVTFCVPYNQSLRKNPNKLTKISTMTVLHLLGATIDELFNDDHTVDESDPPI